MERKKLKGFTLVEMMVAIAIILLLTTIGAVSINKFNTGRKVEMARNELMTQIKLAREMAVTNQIPPGGDGDESLLYVRVILNTDIGITAIAYTSDNRSVTVFSKKIDGVSGVGTSFSGGNDFGFWNGTGRLVNSMGAFLSSGIGITVLSSTGETNNRNYIFIEKSGLINER